VGKKLQRVLAELRKRGKCDLYGRYLERIVLLITGVFAAQVFSSGRKMLPYAALALWAALFISVDYFQRLSGAE